jgi:hypothetical protein
VLRQFPKRRPLCWRNFFDLLHAYTRLFGLHQRVPEAPSPLAAAPLLQVPSADHFDIFDTSPIFFDTFPPGGCAPQLISLHTAQHRAMSTRSTRFETLSRWA